MQNYVGRGVRVILGLVLIYAGLFVLGGALGLLPIGMGVW
jgi:hypothetical protein